MIIHIYKDYESNVGRNFTHSLSQPNHNCPHGSRSGMTVLKCYQMQVCVLDAQ